MDIADKLVPGEPAASFKKMSLSSADEHELEFKVDIKNLRATDLKCRHRFKEKLRVRLFFDDRKFKTDKELVGGGDVSWKNTFSFLYSQSCEHYSMSAIDFVRKQLEQKALKLQVLCQHDEKTTGSPLGQCQVDLYTMATGPMDHNLPLTDGNGAPVGRLFFSVELVQVSEVVVMLKEIHVKNLRSSEEDVFNLNPYLKYGYSKDWPSIVDNKMKATYSEVQHRTPSPSWDEKGMPWLKFRASMNELVRESLVMHVTHKGKLVNTTLGRCNLLFRTLVDGGKSFKEEDLISFKGPLNKKDSGTTIEGRLLFKHLPIFAQMRPVTGGRPAIHTEQGIYDAMPLLTWVPRPTVPIVHSDTPSAEVGTPKTARKGRARADSTEQRPAEPLNQADKFRQKLSNSDAVPAKTKNKDKGLFSSAREVPTADLISFTPPANRKRAVSMAPQPVAPLDFSSASVGSKDDFDIGERPAMDTMFPSTHGSSILQVQQATNPFAAAAPTGEPSFNPFAQQQTQQPSFNPFAV